MISEQQCIHRGGCPKPKVCGQVGHCASDLADDSPSVIGVDAFTWELAKKQLDRLVGLEEELARWKAACTGKHGSQAPCVPPEEPTARKAVMGDIYPCLEYYDEDHTHRWVDGTDPEQQVCLTCDSTRMTPEEPNK